MHSSEVNNSLIGKRCKCMWTGMMVTGTITSTEINKYAAVVYIDFDEPHNWGGEMFERTDAHARLIDEFGSLHHLELI